MKGDIHSSNMRYSGMPCPKNLRRYGPDEGPSESPHVILITNCFKAAPLVAADIAVPIILAKPGLWLFSLIITQA